MKRIYFLLATLALCAGPAIHAQDAATQERLDKLAGRIDDLTAAQEALRKQMSELSRELESVREQANKPNASYLHQEDLKPLMDTIKEVDRKRVDDAEKVRSELLKLRKALEMPPPATKPKPATTPREKLTTDKPPGDEKVFEYVIKKDDTIDAIIQSYKEKNIKVTVAGILKANPGLKPETMRVGRKIYIPAPQP